MIDVSDNFFELLDNHCLLYYSFNLFDSFVLVSHFYNFLVLSHNLFYLLHNNWNLDDLLYNVLNIPVYINNLWNQSFDFDYFGNLNYFLCVSLNFVDLRDSVGFFNYFLNNLLGSNNLLHNALYGNNLLDNSFYLFNLFSNIRYLLDDFFVLDIIDNFLLHSGYFLNLHDLLPYGNYFLDHLGHLNRFLYDLSNGYDFLNNLLDWNWDLHWHNNLSLNFYYLRTFDCYMHNFLDLYVSWNLSDNLNHFLDDYLVGN